MLFCCILPLSYDKQERLQSKRFTKTATNSLHWYAKLQLLMSVAWESRFYPLQSKTFTMTSNTWHPWAKHKRPVSSEMLTLALLKPIGEFFLRKRKMIKVKKMKMKTNLINFLIFPWKQWCWHSWSRMWKGCNGRKICYRHQDWRQFSNVQVAESAFWPRNQHCREFHKKKRFFCL